MEKELNMKIENLVERISKRKNARITDIDGVKRILPIGNFVWQQATEYPEKVFILQEVVSQRNKLLRLGYYIIGKKQKMRGKWAWGQFCPFITAKDLKILIKKAEKAGIL